jgi:hypothetical protein
VKRRATAKYRTQCAWVFAAAKPLDWRIGRVVIEVEYRCPREAKLTHGYVALDSMNAQAAMKGCVDALIDAGVVATDSHHNLSWGPFRLVTRADQMQGKKPGVTMTVRRA